MGGMMQHMSERIQAGPMTPEQTKQMGEMMGHMGEMMNKMSGMMTPHSLHQVPIA
jgi:hypothetical protein